MKKWVWYLVTFVILAADQATKFWVISRFVPYQPHRVMPMLNLTLAYNTGAAFSFLSGAGEWHHWFFLGFSLLVSVLLIIWIFRMPRSERLQLFALSLILGGALGNLVDRMTLGYVIDFIDVYYKNYHWPIFNIADSAICIGTVLMTIRVCLCGQGTEGALGVGESGNVVDK